MTSFYFGAGRRRLFGIYDPARPQSAGSRAVVLCHPWGSEYLHAHRSMRQLADRLALAGFHTLRFDYFGTGDSSGEMTDADLAGWLGDIKLALEELKYASGATQVGLIGMRLGASLAAAAALQLAAEVNTLVLWDPVVSGEEYLRSLHRAAASHALSRAVPADAENKNGHEILGFTLTPTMEHEFQAIDLLPMLSTVSARKLIIVTEMQSSYQALRGASADHKWGSLEVEHVSDVQPWIEDPNTVGTIPVAVLRRIIQWLG